MFDILCSLVFAASTINTIPASFVPFCATSFFALCTVDDHIPVFFAISLTVAFGFLTNTSTTFQTFFLLSVLGFLSTFFSVFTIGGSIVYK
jgi:hypothetical protein